MLSHEAHFVQLQKKKKSTKGDDANSKIMRGLNSTWLLDY